MKYIYDAQIRRILLQICRIFSQFTIPYSVDENGKTIYRRVPARYAGTDMQVQNIITNNSENFMLSLPFMAVSISRLDMDRRRTGTTGVYNKEQISTKKWDEENQTYTHDEGNRYEVTRYQGFPIDIEITLNVFTSNLTQKLQLLEQICLIFNPSMDFQTNTAPMDMYRLNVLELTKINFSDKNFPLDPRKSSFDTLTMTFNAECYISAPASVDIQRNIEQIISNIGFNIEDPSAYDLTPQNRLESTPHGYSFTISDLINSDGSFSGKSLIKINSDVSWKEFLKPYGIYESGVSQFRLRCIEWDTDKQFNPDGTKNQNYEVIGTIQVPSIDIPEQETYSDNVAIWTIDEDSYPELTLNSIDGIIDPHVQIPNKKDITNWLNRDEEIQTIDMTNGIRYMLLEEIASNTEAWGKFYDINGNILDKVNANDIIQYREIGSIGKWIRVFDSQASDKIQYVYSSFDKRIYQFKDNNWNDLINGRWQGGRVRIICKPFADEFEEE